MEALYADMRALGMGGVRSAHSCALYFVDGKIAPEEMDLLGRFVFSDPVVETCAWRVLGEPSESGSKAPGVAGAAARAVIEILRKPGVADPFGEEAVRAAHELGVKGVERVATGTRWEFEGEGLTSEVLETMARRLLANPLVDRWAFGEIQPLFPDEEAQGAPVVWLDVASMDEEALLALSRERRLALDLVEMRAIRDWYRKAGRAASDVELEMLAQTWSEHCVHKTFKARVHVREVDRNGTQVRDYTVDSIFRTFIQNVTRSLDRPWVVSAFVDNAGIVNFDGVWDLSFKVETHNHPSAVEPFGGANTGVGGVIRDIMGVSARPIAVTDVLCFGPQDTPADLLPEGVLHPRLIARGVVEGVEDYGNKMGIPNVNGAVVFHPGYASNPLVYCGCVGLAPRGVHVHQPRPGDHIIVLGGRTGRDGIRGATFSSMTMDASTGEVAGASVQIGEPIVQKRALDVLLEARDAQLYTAVTDCGAGGLSSAIGEMASQLGADIELAGLGTKYPGLSAWELWLSEAQERMVLAVPPEHVAALDALCSKWAAEYWDLGSFRNDGRLVVRHGGEVVLDLPGTFLHEGLPRRQLEASIVRDNPDLASEVLDATVNTAQVMQPAHAAVDAGSRPAGEYRRGHLASRLLELLASPNIASREQIVRRYDHEVQGGTVVKPFAGPWGDAPQDAAVLVPQGTGGAWGIALSNAIRPDKGEVDPCGMAWSCVDEAVRNAVAVGADPDRLAILDNFCMGNPNDPLVMGALVETARGLHDAALAYGTPIISGKDSFYNEYLGGDGRRHAIPPSLLVSAMGFVPDVTKVMTSFLKQAGDPLILVRGSHLLPTDRIRNFYRAIHQAIQAGELAAVHDCAEGGPAVAVAEMCMGSRMGAVLEAQSSEEGHAFWFADMDAALIVEVRQGFEERFEMRMAEAAGSEALTLLGEVQQAPVLEIAGHGVRETIPIDQLLAAWKVQGAEVLP